MEERKIQLLEGVANALATRQAPQGKTHSSSPCLLTIDGSKWMLAPAQSRRKELLGTFFSKLKWGLSV